MSKGLEALKRLVDTMPFAFIETNSMREIDIIEKELKEYEMEHTLRVRLENINYELVREKQENEKKLKALEIIKEKIFNGKDELVVLGNIQLTQEEYDLLKEVLL